MCVYMSLQECVLVFSDIVFLQCFVVIPLSECAFLCGRVFDLLGTQRVRIYLCACASASQCIGVGEVWSSRLGVGMLLPVNKFMNL